MEYPTVYSLFADRVKQYATRGDVFYFRSRDRWQGISWQRFEQETYDFATALLSFDLKRGGTVCILMGNVPEWPISDLGTVSYTHLRAHETGRNLVCRLLLEKKK